MDRKGRWSITAESVTEGHPDKVSDQISDSILDAILAKDKNAKVACETVVTSGLVLVTGEISTKAYVDISQVVKNTIREIGYTFDGSGFDADSCAVLISLEEQSADITAGLNEEQDLGAGDQGLMYGYANSDTEELMPLPIFLAHKLSYALSRYRKDYKLDYLRPDGKSQVTVHYEDEKPVYISQVVMSTQHTEDISLEQLREILKKEVILPNLPADLIDENTIYHINPAGNFIVGGPQADSGLTGRKIIVDTYGGFARHGGGAFSGKDPTKVDRSASYAARYAAKNIVKAGLARSCEVQLAYAIGFPEPVDISVNTFNTAILPDEKILEILVKNMSFKPRDILKRFDLRRPIYAQTACYGHFGRKDLNLPWENLDLALALKADAKIN